MSERLSLTVEKEEAGERLDAFLAYKLGEEDGVSYTRSYIQKLIERGAVTVFGEPEDKNYRVKTGDSVSAEIEPPRELAATPQDIPIEIEYEDDSLLVVYKPKGMVVHPAPGNPDKTLVNALLFRCGDSLSGINGVIRPGIVHRIDKDTSGLLVVAKNDAAHLSLSRQIAEHTVDRVYEAVVHGRIFEGGRIDLPIGRSEKDRKKFCVTTKNSRNAATRYEVVDTFERYTHLRLSLETGRTHQIRVHTAHMGHPVAGDTVYGPKNTPRELMGQCLHAGTLGFIHPVTGERMVFRRPLPEYFTDFISKIDRGMKNV